MLIFFMSPVVFKELIIAKLNILMFVDPCIIV